VGVGKHARTHSEVVKACCVRITSQMRVMRGRGQRRVRRVRRVDVGKDEGGYLGRSMWAQSERALVQ
jgi:hypothetical protein